MKGFTGSFTNLGGLVGTKLSRSKSESDMSGSAIIDNEGENSQFTEVTQRRNELQGCCVQDFRVKGSLGEGSFALLHANVRMVKHRKTGRTYAVKVLFKQLVKQSQQVEYVEREKAMLYNLTHPFLDNLYAALEDETYLYMCMDLNSGESLSTHLRNAGAFSMEETRFYTATVVSVLEYLHDRDIVHRDLKPENLVLDAAGYLKLTDFGSAKLLNKGEKTFTMCGSPEFQAPEIVAKKGHNHAADWWALGVVVFQFLSGKTPFEAEGDVIQTQRAITAVKFTFPDNFSKEAKELIGGMLSTSKSRRLGVRKGAKEVRALPFFKNFDFDGLMRRHLDAPDRTATRMSVGCRQAVEERIAADQQQVFANF